MAVYMDQPIETLWKKLVGGGGGGVNGRSKKKIDPRFADLSRKVIELVRYFVKESNIVHYEM